MVVTNDVNFVYRFKGKKIDLEELMLKIISELKSSGIKDGSSEEDWIRFKIPTPNGRMECESKFSQDSKGVVVRTTGDWHASMGTALSIIGVGGLGGLYISNQVKKQREAMPNQIKQIYDNVAVIMGLD